jgi:putative DNA primase/helicase
MSEKTAPRKPKDPVVLAKLMMDNNPDIVRCEENVYRYNGKCYDLMTDKDLDALFLTFCIANAATECWKNINSVVRAFLVFPGAKKVAKMNDYAELICLNNGILNIHTKEFIPHSSDYYFDSYINVDFDPEARDCPVFGKYLTDTFSGDLQVITNIIRLGGYLLDTSCAAERMFLFDGNGANGKSVLINIFSMFFSDEQISPLSLDVLSSNGFSKEMLIKSRVNFCAEQKKAYLDSEEIKKIITGDRIEINRKFKTSLSFLPKTKIIVACNGLPKFNDNTHAIYRRLIIIRFHNQYLSEMEYQKVKQLSRDNVFIKDKNLFEKIKAEKSAILNLFITGLVELRENNYDFIESADSVAAMASFKRDSDTVKEFLDDHYVADPAVKTPLRQVFEHYRQWYRYNVQDSGVMKFRINEMGKRIVDIMGVQSCGQVYLFNSETHKSERETAYPIRLIEVTPEMIETEAVVESFKQQEIDL